MFAWNTYSTENNSHVYFSPQLISCMFSSSIFSNVNIVHLVSLGIPFLCLSIYLPSSVCLSPYPSFCLFPSLFTSLCPYLPIALSLLSHSKAPCISANSTILHETIFTALNGSCSLSFSPALQLHPTFTKISHSPSFFSLQVLDMPCITFYISCYGEPHSWCFGLFLKLHFTHQ